jgi:protein SCO1/2
LAWIATSVGGLAWPASRSIAAASHGRIEPPEPVPDIALIRDDGSRTTLVRLTQGRTTALHFMFTGCASTCPIQGASFAQLQQILAGSRTPGFQLLSISVDALGDDAASLARWRARLSAGPDWRAAVPTVAHATRLSKWAGGGRPYDADTHSTQVLLIDERSRLAFRTTDLPDATQLAGLLRALQQVASR